MDTKKYFKSVYKNIKNAKTHLTLNVITRQIGSFMNSLDENTRGRAMDMYNKSMSYITKKRKHLKS